MIISDHFETQAAVTEGSLLLQSSGLRLTSPLLCSLSNQNLEVALVVCLSLVNK